MNPRDATLAVVALLVVVGGVAAFQSRTGSTVPAPLETAPTAIDVPTEPTLPPGHPPMGPSDPSHPTNPSAPPAIATEAAPLVWVAPPSWRSVPNPSPMRLATYRVPRAAGDDQDGELSVTRAGGTAEANIERWIGQFEESATSARAEKTVHGLHVTVVSIKGTFLGGGMTPGAPSSPRTSWALLGAIVESPGSSYFFKLVGPASTLSAAGAPFDAMINGLTRS
jgi:hypothetical protein